jgi:hypothetical protein
MPTVSGGFVDADGTPLSLTGDVASIVHESKGHYEINFNSPQATLVVSQVPNFDGDTRDNAVVSHVDFGERTSFIVKTGDSGGDPQDRNFSFIAISSS